jgi:FMN phosphatase YigB (HAD superfamily)
LIDLVCFDLGGVVVRIRRTFRDCCAAAGVPHVDVPYDAAEHGLLDRDLQLGAIDARDYAERLAALYRGAYTPETILTVWDAVLDREYDGVCALIDRIHASGRRTALLSNTCEPHWRVLLRWPSLAKIQHHFASHLIRELKPDAAAYRAVERGTGVPPERILFFDDTPANVTAARRCGWQAALVDPFAPTAPQLAAELEARGVQ